MTKQRRLSLLLASVVALSLVGYGCGDDDSSDDNDAGVQHDSSTHDSGDQDSDVGEDGDVEEDAGGDAGGDGRAVTVVNCPEVPDATIAQASTMFSPDTATVSVGEVVRFQWSMGVHTTTSGTIVDNAGVSDGLWDEDLTTDSQAVCIRFDAPGSYPFFCRPHAPLGMDGVVTVTE